MQSQMSRISLPKIDLDNKRVKKRARAEFIKEESKIGDEIV